MIVPVRPVCSGDAGWKSSQSSTTPLPNWWKSTATIHPQFLFRRVFLAKVFDVRQLHACGVCLQPNDFADFLELDLLIMQLFPQPFDVHLHGHAKYMSFRI